MFWLFSFVAFRFCGVNQQQAGYMITFLFTNCLLQPQLGLTLAFILASCIPKSKQFVCAKIKLKTA
jgi:hypothetical protein